MVGLQLPPRNDAYGAALRSMYSETRCVMLFDHLGRRGRTSRRVVSDSRTNFEISLKVCLNICTFNDVCAECRTVSFWTYGWTRAAARAFSSLVFQCTISGSINNFIIKYYLRRIQCHWFFEETRCVNKNCCNRKKKKNKKHLQIMVS